MLSTNQTAWITPGIKPRKVSKTFRKKHTVKPTCNNAPRGGKYPSDLKVQRSAGIQIVKYQAFVLWHSFPMSNTNNAVVEDLKPARRELRQKTSTALQHLKRECHFLRVV
ncbi:MAG: hypothetical protein ACI8R8_000721, partial [Paraglaciecola sp.]